MCAVQALYQSRTQYVLLHYPSSYRLTLRSGHSSQYSPTALPRVPLSRPAPASGGAHADAPRRSRANFRRHRPCFPLRGGAVWWCHRFSHETAARGALAHARVLGAESLPLRVAGRRAWTPCTRLHAFPSVLRDGLRRIARYLSELRTSLPFSLYASFTPSHPLPASRRPCATSHGAIPIRSSRRPATAHMRACARGRRRRECCTRGAVRSARAGTARADVRRVRSIRRGWARSLAA
jgi:hypothetical protein